MNKFSIKDIETITGIKCQTIRVWEQRYNFLHTKRTDTNIRYYNDDDLRLLLNVSTLNDNGYKISEIANMSSDEMSEKIHSITHQDNNYSCYIQALSIHAISFNEFEFKKTLSSSIKKIGLEQTVLQVIYPFLQSIGIMWQTGSMNPAQEHFASSLIKQKLTVAIDNLKVPTIPNHQKFLLFLPEGEFHEIALLFGSYLIKSHGHEVLYLGQSLSINYVKDVLKAYQPDYIFSIMTNSMTQEDAESVVQLFSSSFPNNKVIIAGGCIHEQHIKTRDNISLLKGIPDLLSFLNEINFD